MTSSKHEGSEHPGLRRSRWFGSFRIRPDGRLDYSQWSYLDASHVALKVANDLITVVSGGLMVMLLYLERNRIVSACFPATLEPDQLREAVAELRDASHGLDSWVVPALEYNYGWSSVREDPEMSKVVLELLASCRNLPVAKQWKRVRAQYFINQGATPPELPATKAPVLPVATRAPRRRSNRGSGRTARTTSRR